MAHKKYETKSTSRRTILKVGALTSLAALGGGTGLTTAQSETELPVEIGVFPEEEYVSILNVGEDDLDLTGYSLNFDAEGGNNQIRELAGDVSIAPGNRIIVPTGASSTVTTADVAGLRVELSNPYTGEVLANDGSDVVALLDPEGNEVARSGAQEDTPAGPIDVTVLDAETGDPIQGAIVDVLCNFAESSGDEGRPEETNEDGVVTIPILPSEGYSVCSFDVYAEGYESDRIEIRNPEDVEDLTVELTPTEDGETHTATVVVTDTDGVRIEGADVSVVTYDGGEDVGDGTTDECGEVQFKVEDGTYEVSTSTEELSQSSANRLVGVNGEDATLVINLFDPDEEDGPEEGNITEPEPCEAGEQDPGDGSGNDTDESGDDTTDDQDDGTDAPDKDATDDTSDPAAENDGTDDETSGGATSGNKSTGEENGADDDCPKN